MEYFVNKGAKLKCSMGSEQSELEVVHIGNPVLLCGKLMANIADNKPAVNIKPFGKCSSMANPAVAAATAANYGRLQKMPCVPITPFPWLNGKMNLIINGSPALLSTSKCACSWSVGRLIDVSDPGQNSVYVGGPMNITINEPTPETQQALGGGLLSSQDTAGIATQGAMASGFQAAGSDSALQPNSLQPAGGGTQASQSAETATTETQGISIEAVTGPAKAFSKQKLKYEITEYSVKKSQVSNDDRNKIRWAVKVGDEAPDKLEDEKGKESIDLEIPDDWATKDIRVIASIEGSGIEKDCGTNIGPLSQMLLIRKVEGEEYASSGQKLIYKVTGTNKDVLDDRDKNKIKWAIKVEGIDSKTLKKKNGEEITGDNLTLGIKKEHIDGGRSKITVTPYLDNVTEGKEFVFTIENGKASEIIVMPHLKTPTDIVSVKTKVCTSLGSAIKENLDSGLVNIIFTYKDSHLFIEKLINDMKTEHLNTGWLEEVSNSNIKHTKLESNRGIAANIRNERAFVINVNHELFQNEIIDEKVLQSIVLHELRHVWQEQSEEWVGNIYKNRTRDLREYINILIEVDAFDTQFSFEKEPNKVNYEIINKIRDYFNNNTSKVLRAEHLMLPVRLQDGTLNIYGRGYYNNTVEIVTIYGGEDRQYHDYTDGSFTEVSYNVLARSTQ